jgi:large subunit ribosomal protein L29
MRIKDLRGKNNRDLLFILENLLRKRLKLRIQVSTSSFTKVHLFRELKRTIARVKTVLKENKIKEYV